MALAATITLTACGDDDKTTQENESITFSQWKSNIANSTWFFSGTGNGQDNVNNTTFKVYEAVTISLTENSGTMASTYKMDETSKTNGSVKTNTDDANVAFTYEYVPCDENSSMYKAYLVGVITSSDNTDYPVGGKILFYITDMTKNKTKMYCEVSSGNIFRKSDTQEFTRK